MPKKGKKIKKQLVVKKTPSKKVSFLKKYTLPILVVATIILGALLYNNLLYSADINMITEGEGGGGSTSYTPPKTTTNTNTTANPCTKIQEKAGWTAKNKQCIPPACKSACQSLSSYACKSCLSSNSTVTKTNQGGGGRPVGMPAQSGCSKNNPSACCQEAGMGELGKLATLGGLFDSSYNGNYIKTGTINPIIGNVNGVAVHTGTITCYGSQSAVTTKGNKYCENLNPHKFLDGTPYDGVLTCEKTCNGVALKIGINGKSIADYKCQIGSTTNGKTTIIDGVCCGN